MSALNRKADIHSRAAELIDELGLHRGSMAYGHGLGPYCAVGAVRTATTGSPYELCEYPELLYVVGAETGDNFVENWSDGNDKAGVVSGLLAAASLAMDGESAEKPHTSRKRSVSE